MNYFPTTTITHPIRLIAGRDPLARIQCGHCKALFLPYVDRGDGQVLRYAAGASYVTKNADGTYSAPELDYSATTGRAVAANDVYANCPECSGIWNNVGGKRGADFVGIKGRMGTNACDSVCAFGTGTTCKCSCGGTNHGSRA